MGGTPVFISVYCNTITLQCCVSSEQYRESAMCIHISPHLVPDILEHSQVGLRKHHYKQS